MECLADGINSECATKATEVIEAFLLIFHLLKR
jgi:hypothetical protein